MNALAVGGIGLDQRYVSPYKGFCCANRALNDGLSCSEFGKRAFSRFPVAKAWALLRRRLEQCKAAYRAIRVSRVAAVAVPVAAISQLHAEADDKSEEKPRNTSSAHVCDALSNAGTCIDMGDAGACACDVLGLMG